MSFTSSFAAVFDDVFARWRRNRTEARTRRAIGTLSPHVRRDIDWPGGTERLERSLK